MISVFDIFKIGIGPSSSHTVGPMCAALTFAKQLEQQNHLQSLDSITTEFYGSLGATGKGHNSNIAVILGFLGESPESIDPDTIKDKLSQIEQTEHIQLLNQHPISFNETKHLLFHRKALPFHSNSLVLPVFG